MHNTEVKALTGLAMLYVLKGQYETAYDHFNRAIELQTSLTQEEEIAWAYVSMIIEKIPSDEENLCCFKHLKNLKKWTPKYLKKAQLHAKNQYKKVSLNNTQY